VANRLAGTFGHFFATMKNLLKLIAVVIVLVMNNPLSAQPVYQLDNHSPIAVGEIAIRDLKKMEAGSWSEEENLLGSYYLDATASLTETDVYALRKKFEPIVKIPEAFPRSTIYWRYYAVENITNRDIQLLDNFRPRAKECKTFVWKNGISKGGLEYSKYSLYNEFKEVSPFEKDSAIAEIRVKKIVLGPREKLEFLVRCTPVQQDISNKEGSLFNSEMIYPAIKLVQSEPMEIWSRWPLFTRGIMLGVFFALVCSSLLTSIVDRTQKSWLLTAWLLITTFAYSWNQDFFEFFYDTGNASILSVAGGVALTLRRASDLVFLFFSYQTLGGSEKFFNSRLLRLLKKPIILAAGLCVVFEALIQAPTILFSISMELGNFQSFVDLYQLIFGNGERSNFYEASAIFYVVSLFLLKLFVLYVAGYEIRHGSKSALFILLALIFLTFADSTAIVGITAAYFDDMQFINYLRIRDQFPISFVPLVIQALIMFYAVFSRNKEIQISLAEMTLNRQRFIEEQNTLLENRVVERTQELQMQTEKTEKLMLNILPQSIAERLKDGDKEVSDKYQNTTILFSDLVGFTKMSSEKTPEELVFLLNDLFKRFDIRALSLGLEKIKTIGDAYMVVGGLPTVDDTHAIRVTKMALGMYEDLAEFNAQHGVRFDMRIGINSGPVVAGVIGHSKFSYDLWGNAVNTASRMESTSVPGKIQVSPSTFEQIKDHFDVQEHQLVECKGLGQIMTYFVNGQLPAGGPAFG